MIKIFTFFPLYFSSFFLRYFFKVERKLLLFSTQGGRTYEGNAKYLFIYLSKYTNYKCIWITKNKKIKQQIIKSGYDAKYYFSWDTLLLSMKAYAIFITHSLSDVMPVFYNKSTIIINIWHAIPIKNISFLDKNLNFLSRILDLWRDKRSNYFISNSISFNNYYLKAFKIIEKKIVIGGLPRIDFLKEPKKFIKDLKNPFENNKTIFLYAPTFRDYPFINPFYNNNFLKNFERYLIKNNSVLYIKNHPFEKNKPDTNKYSKINFLGNSIDIYELLPFVGKLICDYSSIIYDFKIAYPKKEIYLFCPDIEKYEVARGFVDSFREVYNNDTYEDFLNFKKLNRSSNFFNSNRIYTDLNSSCEEILKLLG